MTENSIGACSWSFGRNLHGYAWEVNGPRGVVLLQHGYAEHAGRYVEHYARLVPKLGSLGLSVYAFDMRGHGLSPGPRAVTDMAESIDDHRAARQALAAKGIPIFLFGHSLGGLVTAASVNQDTTEIAGVVLSSPALLLPSSATIRTLARALAAVAPRLKLMPPQPPTGLSRLPDEVAAFMTDELVYHGRMPAKLAAGALSVSRKAWTRYPNWIVPTLVLHGTADTFTDFRGSQLFAAMIRSPDKTLITVQRGHHELLNDVDRDITSDAIIDWLRFRS